MVDDWKDEYWREALDVALEDEGFLDAIPDEAKANIAGSLRVSAEQESMAGGHGSAPNPLQAKVDELRKELDSERQRSGQWQDAFRKNVSKRRNVPENAVEIKADGSAVYYP